MLVRDLMTPAPFEVPSNAPLREAFNRMDTHHVSHLVVTSPDGLCGIISRHDVNLFMRADLDMDSTGAGTTFWMSPRFTVRMAMSKEPITVNPDTPIADAARRMVDAHIHSLLVVEPDSGDLVGILTSTDLLRVIAEKG